MLRRRLRGAMKDGVKKRSCFKMSRVRSRWRGRRDKMGKKKEVKKERRKKRKEGREGNEGGKRGKTKRPAGRRCAANHLAVKPPSITTVVPVTNSFSIKKR